MIASLFAAIVGSMSFWGSLIAFGKLQEILPGRPIGLGRAQQFVNGLLLVGAVACAVVAGLGGASELWIIGLLVLAAVLGVLVVLPIGGADMPVVISLLNALTGLSAAAAGLALDNTAMIVAGMIVGASGLDPDQPHGHGDEPLDPGDRGRRFRRHHDAARGRTTASTAPCARPAPPTRRSRWPTRHR